MPPKKSLKKRAAVAKTKVDEVTENTSKLKVYAPFSMMYVCPYILLDHMEEFRRTCTCEFLVPTLPQASFRPKVTPSGCILELYTIAPGFFSASDRLMAVHHADAGFMLDTHKATACESIAQGVQEQCDFSDEIIDDPERVKVPYPVEQEIVSWELQDFDNEEGNLADDLGGAQFFFVLSVKMVTIIKFGRLKESSDSLVPRMDLTRMKWMKEIMVVVVPSRLECSNIPLDKRTTKC